jgi:dihydrofolate synthase / folylpolyglutamate synthase
MTYDAAVSYLYNLQKHGIKLGLETMTALILRLGRPDARYRILHIAGTNGKGSTAAMTAAMLQAAGYRVGLYTSPHLVEFGERIRVDGRMISETDIARFTEVVKEAAEPDLSPTFFECTTAIALQYFADAQVDVAVLEVGLGGRFDATNIVTPVACAVTTIALDHQEYLGTTLSSIAYEKAGIIKPRVPVVLGRMSDEARETIEQVAAEHAAPLSRFGREFEVVGMPERFRFSGRALRYDDLFCPLQGAHQVDNCACALSLIEAAGEAGLDVREPAVREGLRKVQWQGRLEVVDRAPLTVLDGAHNPAAAVALAEYLRGFRRSNPESRVILVLGMMRDKDHRGFAKPFQGLVDEVVLTQAGLARSATVEDLRAAVSELWPSARVEAVLADALALARRLARAEDLMCVTGSLMLIGDVKALRHVSRISPLRG